MKVRDPYNVVHMYTRAPWARSPSDEHEDYWRTYCRQTFYGEQESLEWRSCNAQVPLSCIMCMRVLLQAPEGHAPGHGDKDDDTRSRTTRTGEIDD